MNTNNRQRKLVSFGIIALLVNSAYLAAFTEATLFYLSNVLFHIIFGILLLVWLINMLIRRLKQFSSNDAWAAIMLFAGLFGGLLLVIGNTHNHKWALNLHIGLTILSLCLFAFSSVEWFTMSRRTFSLLLLLSLGLPIFMQIYQYYQPHHLITNPTTIPTAMEGEGDGANSPFFPSSATTNVHKIIPSNFFMSSKRCGECHGEIYKQWNSSMHHFSSFNNQWYKKSIEYMQDVDGITSSKWCAGCHDHAVFFNGRFDKPIKDQMETPEAQAGLSCTSCHSIVNVKSTMGQGDFEIEYPPLHDLATSSNPIIRSVHDLLMNADPGPHKKTFLKDFHKESTAEFCSSCHKVHLDKPVNNYRWFRGFNDYDNWQASGVSGQGGRSFYTTAQSMKCVDCHMPMVEAKDPAAINGKIHSHRFPAANTAIPYVNSDEEQLRTVTDFLKDKAISVDIFAMSKSEPLQKRPALPTGAASVSLSSSFAIGEESLRNTTPKIIAEPEEVSAPLNKIDAVVRRGDSVRLDVVVRTRKVGHFFPGGTVDAFDVWVELQAMDNRGQIIFWSGMTEDDKNGHGPVDPSAHFYRALLLDENGNRINKRNAWAGRSVVYVRLIAPNSDDTVHYRLNIPKDCGDQITIKAKVHYRKFSWWNTQWSYAGVPDPTQQEASVTKTHDDRRWVFTGDTSHVSGNIKSIPDIPIVTMAEDQATLRVIDETSPVPKTSMYLDKSVYERWNDYGIGLLLQGDIKAAEAAFLKVTQMVPDYADGWINIARARIQEGRLNAAQEVLVKALQLQPNFAKANFFLALTLKGQGKYDQALEHLSIAVKQFPRDRVMLNETGRVLFLKRQYQQGIAMFQRVLEVDPEDLQAHYNLMLCYRGLGNDEMTKKEEILYRRFKADESSQAITGPFRKLNPEDNNERQSIHEHNSVSAEKIQAYQQEMSVRMSNR